MEDVIKGKGNNNWGQHQKILTTSDLWAKNMFEGLFLTKLKRIIL